MIRKILKKIKKKFVSSNEENFQIIKKVNENIFRFNFYKSKGIDFNEVLDIGAFEGYWTKDFKEIFPDSNVLMIEANSDKEEKLEKIGKYKIELLGDQDGKEIKYFKCQHKGIETGNTVFEENTKFKFLPEIRFTKKLDTLFPNKSFDLIKMDVQGSELDIIKGGSLVIKNTKYLLLELQTAEYNKGAPRAEDVISYLKNINFQFIDIFDLIYRNGCLIQFDAFFQNNHLNPKKIVF